MGVKIKKVGLAKKGEGLVFLQQRKKPKLCVMKSNQYCNTRVSKRTRSIGTLLQSVY